MRKCIAFCPDRARTRRWVPCSKRATHGSAVCEMHADSLAGIVFGLGVLVSQAIAKTTAFGSPDAVGEQDFAEPEDAPQNRKSKSNARPPGTLIQ
jgi:hypothetical protein